MRFLITIALATLLSASAFARLQQGTYRCEDSYDNRFFMYVTVDNQGIRATQHTPEGSYNLGTAYKGELDGRIAYVWHSGAFNFYFLPELNLVSQRRGREKPWTYFCDLLSPRR